MTWTTDRIEHASRFRLYPTPHQEALLGEQCGHARFVWNLGLEQRLMWRRERGPAPGYHGQAAQLTEARKAEPWLAGGSQTVQQQALRDLDQAWRNFFAGTHRKPTWRKRGIHEGFRIVGPQASRIRQDNRRWSSVLVPKVGWVALRRTRDLPEARSYRITRDRSGRWHIAFAAVPGPIPGPGTGEVVGVDRGVTVAAALSTGEMTSPGGLRPKEAERLRRPQRQLARAQRGSHRRAVLKLRIARLTARQADRRKDWIEKTSTGLARLEHKAPGRVVKVNPAYTSLTCHACEHRAPDNRESQAVFRCRACGHQANADVNAARNIAQGSTAVGRTVAARGDRAKSARSVKREPQRATSSRGRP